MLIPDQLPTLFFRSRALLCLVASKGGVQPQGVETTPHGLTKDRAGVGRREEGGRGAKRRNGTAEIERIKHLRQARHGTAP